MKKIFTLTLSLLIGAAAFGQDIYDDLMLSFENYEGSARTMAMGGAFTALGGDLGAISINPAGSGVFRCSEVSFTPSLNFHNSSTDYSGYDTKGSVSRFNMANFGAVLTFDTGRASGLLNYNFSATLSRKSNFNSITQAYGTTSGSSYVGSLAAEFASSGIPYYNIDLDIVSNPFNNTSSYYWPHILMYNAYMFDLDKDKPSDDAAYIANTYTRDGSGNLVIPGELSQELYRRTRGGIDEITLNFGGNISDKLFFGVSLNIEDVDYTVEESVSEYTNNSGLYDTGFEQVTTNYWRETSGVGINAKLGLIYTPVAGLRLGATFTTPTYYELTDSWDYTVYSYFDGSNKTYQNCHRESPSGVYDWKSRSPMRFSLGAAYVFGDKGLISADYERVDYSSISKDFNATNILRLGAEVRVGGTASLRAGFIHYDAPYDGHFATNLVSGGLGFNFGKSFTLDVAYQHMLQTSETFNLYSSYAGALAPTGCTTRTNGKLSVSLAWKF